MEVFFSQHAWLCAYYPLFVYIQNIERFSANKLILWNFHSEEYEYSNLHQAFTPAYSTFISKYVVLRSFQHLPSMCQSNPAFITRESILCNVERHFGVFFGCESTRDNQNMNLANTVGAHFYKKSIIYSKALLIQNILSFFS